MKKFVLLVKYGYGKAAMLTDTPDLTLAIKEFVDLKSKDFPDDKCYGLPPVTKAELLPLLQPSKYEEK